MKKMKRVGTFLSACSLTVCGLLPGQTPVDPDALQYAETMPVFRVTSVARTAKAINYQHRSGATKIDFAGTSLLPNARGEAKVESKQGYMEIEVEFDNLQPATKNGAEYLTYVLWAISPEGRTANLGEILLNGTKSKLNVTTELQVFGLVVTAEPYFSVTRPSDVVVMENVVRADTKGKIVEMDAKYELLKRGQYEQLANPLELKLDRKVPLELYEARNAVQIARASGAEHYASETFQKAENSLQQAEAYQTRKAGKKPVTMSARQAVQTAEDARAIAVQRQEEEALANERQAGVDREALAEQQRAAAQSEAERVTRNAETARLDAQNQADRRKRDNDARSAAAQTEADRLKSANDAQRNAAQLEADRLKQQNDARAAAALADADRLKRENDAQRAAVQADLDRAARERAEAEAEKTELRAQLLQQFSAILETRDSARGLIVNMSDVLFDTAKFTLRPAAREKLAKVAGVVSGHPGLTLEVEGHTDSIGEDDYNQQLSEERGEAVRDYLTGQGVAQNSVTSRGFGETQPSASNENAAGRQQNRRVELVVSGEIIGGQIGTPTAAVR
jgi:outer membrane protein OmpA-like peptidoglycan-associated protein